MAQRLRRSQVDAIDLIDDIEAIERYRAKSKSGGRTMRKRAEVSRMRMQAFRVWGLGQMGLIGRIRRGQRRGFGCAEMSRGFGFIAKASEVMEWMIKAE